jgi:methyltransferase
MWPSLFLTVIVGVQRLLELGVARKNEAWARANGAIEYGKEHYWMFFVLHPAWILALLLEGSLRNAGVAWWAVVVYIALQFARYSIIATLGTYWNTKILIVPGGARVKQGWYSFIKHPNYLVVALELFITPLIVGAWVTALLFTLLNALVMLVRIPLEEKVLRQHYEGS